MTVLAAATLLLGSCSKKTPTLNLLVWEGYADPSFVHDFRGTESLQGFGVVHGIERRTGRQAAGRQRRELRRDFTVERRGDDDREDGLAAPLDLSKLPSYAQLSPQLTSLPLVKANGNSLWRAVHVGTGSADL